MWKNVYFNEMLFRERPSSGEGVPAPLKNAVLKRRAIFFLPFFLQDFNNARASR
jgi:hypothetical protein